MSASATRVDVAKYYAVVLAGDTRMRRRLRLWLFNRDFHCVLAYRFGRWADRVFEKSGLLGAVPVAVHRVWSRYNSTIHHFSIERAAQIGPGLLVMHRHGVEIGSCRIGANAVIHQNVTLGDRAAGADRGVPDVGDRVWIGPGAVLSGAIKIGDGVTISAGTVLSKSVPDACLVAGNPGRVIRTDYDNAAMINFRF